MGVANGIEGWGSGQGIQFDTMGIFVNKGSFVNDRPISMLMK